LTNKAQQKQVFPSKRTNTSLKKAHDKVNHYLDRQIYFRTASQHIKYKKVASSCFENKE